MFTPIKNKKVYEYVIDQIKNMIMEGKLKKGDKLPSERILSEKLGVSRTSIREAFRALEIIGLLESRQGEGNFVKGEVGSNFFEPLSVMFMLNKGEAKYLLEVRKMVEIEAVMLAAKRIEKKDCEELRMLLDDLIKSKNKKDSAKIDKKIHYKIAQITGNPLIVNLLNSISDLMETFIFDAREKLISKKDRKIILNKQHKEIVNSVIEKDPIKAAKKMREHLEFIDEVIEKL